MTAAVRWTKVDDRLKRSKKWAPGTKYVLTTTAGTWCGVKEAELLQPGDEVVVITYGGNDLCEVTTKHGKRAVACSALRKARRVKTRSKSR